MNDFTMQVIFYVAILIPLLFVQLCVKIQAKTCEPDELMYTFTECDQSGGRWRVLVPRFSSNCTIDLPTTHSSIASATTSLLHQPKRVNGCLNSCEPGYHFDNTNLSCEPCQPGYYSLGDGRQFNLFDSEMVKKNFQISSEILNGENRVSSSMGRSCPKWSLSQEDKTLKLVINFNSFHSVSCVTSLMYRVKIIKSGYIKFTYQYNDPADSSLFEFSYKNYNKIRAESNDNDDDDTDAVYHRLIKSSPGSQKELWRNEKIELKSPGFHVFTWKISMIGLDLKDRSPHNSEAHNELQAHVVLKSIEILGIEHTPECTPCGRGTYGNETASSRCRPCPANTANDKFGQTRCQICDLEREFANYGFIQCLPKPVCGLNDYHQIYGPCIISNNTQLVKFAWVQPKVCVGGFLPAERYESCHLHLGNTSMKAMMTSRIDAIIDRYDKANKPSKQHSIWSGDRICNPGLGMAVSFGQNSTQKPLVASSMKEVVKKLSSLIYKSDIANYIDSGQSVQNDEPKSIADLQYLCGYCPEGTFNDGFDLNCRECPNYKIPQYKLSIMTWSKHDPIFKDFISTRSLGIGHGSAYEDEVSAAWIIPDESDSYIRTAPGSLLGTYTILNLVLPGFRSANGGNISFKFELDCGPEDTCLLAYFINFRDQEDYPIKFWTESTNGPMTFTHSVGVNYTFTLSWAFKRQVSYQSSVLIHELNVTNSLAGRAVSCDSCSTKIVDFNRNRLCLQCQPGSYFSDSEDQSTNYMINSNISETVLSNDHSKYCHMCPQNTFVNQESDSDKKACTPCKDNLVSNAERTKCFGNCTFNIEKEDFDIRFNSKFFTNFQTHKSIKNHESKEELIMKTKSLFAADGREYFHEFRMSLCGEEGNAMCNNTQFEWKGYAESDVDHSPSFIKAFICRTTIMPGVKEAIKTQSISLGDKLEAILEEGDVHNGLGIHPDFLLEAQLEREGGNQNLQLISLHYSTLVPTSVCPKGFRVIVALRCSKKSYTKPGHLLNEDQYEIAPPNSCDYGTCDGCSYYFMITSTTSLTCRLCRHSDFTKIVGECIDGQQKVHHVNPTHCALKTLTNGSNKTLPVTYRKCVNGPSGASIFFTIIALIIAIITINVFIISKIKRKMQYKYSKLLNNESDKSNFENNSLSENSSTNAETNSVNITTNQNDGYIDVDIMPRIDDIRSTSSSSGLSKGSTSFLSNINKIQRGLKQKFKSIHSVNSNRDDLFCEEQDRSSRFDNKNERIQLSSINDAKFYA